MPLATQSHFPKAPFIWGSNTPRNKNSSPKNVLNNASVAKSPNRLHCPIHCFCISGVNKVVGSYPAGGAKKGKRVTQKYSSHFPNPISSKATRTIKGTSHHHRLFCVK